MQSSRTRRFITPPRVSFTPTANHMPEPHFLHAIAMMPGGSVLMAGGFAGSGIFIFLNAQTAATSIRPLDQQLYPHRSLNISRADIDATLLNDGNIFIPGGTNFQGQSLANAELYPAGTPQSRRKIFAASAIAISGGMHSERVDQRAMTLDRR